MAGNNSRSQTVLLALCGLARRPCPLSDPTVPSHTLHSLKPHLRTRVLPSVDPVFPSSLVAPQDCPRETTPLPALLNPAIPTRTRCPSFLWKAHNGSSETSRGSPNPSFTVKKLCGWFGLHSLTFLNTTFPRYEIGTSYAMGIQWELSEIVTWMSSHKGDNRSRGVPLRPTPSPDGRSLKMEDVLDFVSGTAHISSQQCYTKEFN